MNRNEFLRILRESLELSLEQDAINSQIDYYDKYIFDEMEMGRNEKEVIEELGDPRLIAKTIKTISANDSSAIKIDFNNRNYYNGSDNDENHTSSNRSYGGYRQSNKGNRYYDGYVNGNGGIGCVIAGLVMFIIVYGILSFMGRIAYGIGELAFSGPIGFLLVLGLCYLFFCGGRRR